MTKLIPVKYRKIDYPDKITANIYEVAGNFDRENIDVSTPYSLHTEYSFEEREFNTNIIKDLTYIKEAQKNKIPQLWFNKNWTKEFFIFIDRLIDVNEAPEVLEIHPPYNEYCSSFEQFFEIFKVFYEEFKRKEKYKFTKIVIENRFGTKNNSGKFLLSTCDDVLKFCELLNKSDIDLKIILDYPQLFSVVYSTNKEKQKELKKKGIMIDEEILEKIILFNQDLKKYRKIIGGIHMWGKRINKKGEWSPHFGNFNTLFSKNNYLKKKFLESVKDTFNDDIPRYFVPEVNGRNDLHSIVNDMIEEGFIFESNVL